MHSIFEEIKRQKIVATVVIDDINNALPLAETLVNAGLKSIELTLRTDCALDAIELINSKMPEMLVGAGTVLTVDQAVQVKDAGGQFAVSPGLNSKVLEKAIDIDLPFAPGIATPSEVEQALGFDLKYLKFFPADPLGGLKYLKCMSAPYIYKGLEFMPLGGVNESNFMEYLKDGCIFAVGGSWLAPRKKIAEGDWKGIGELCCEAVEKLSELN